MKGRRPALYFTVHSVMGRRPTPSFEWFLKDPHLTSPFTLWTLCSPHLLLSDSYNTYTKVKVVSPCEVWQRNVKTGFYSLNLCIYFIQMHPGPSCTKPVSEVTGFLVHFLLYNFDGIFNFGSMRDSNGKIDVLILLMRICFSSKSSASLLSLVHQ